MAEKQYKVTLPKTFAASRRMRGGVGIPAGREGYVGSLTEEQLEAIEADPQLTVEELEVEADESDKPVDLNKMTRPELNVYAAEHGIEEPEKFANKDELIKALEDAQTNQ